MKNKMNNNISSDIAFGAIAGIIGGFALAGTAAFIYGLTSKKDTIKEALIEPRDPFIVMAEKTEKLIGINLNERQKKLFEQSVSTALTASAGAGYALLTRKWKLNWLLGGVVFGGLFWVAEDEGLSPALGLVGDNTKYPLEAHVRGLAAHVIFGIVTAALLKAFQSDNNYETTA